MRRYLHYTSSVLPGTRARTSRSSSIKSPTRTKERPSPMTTSGSSPARSVHCHGTRRTAVSSTCSRMRFPYGVYRSPTQTNWRPVSGWNGCVTRIRCVPGTMQAAFWSELQAALPGKIPLVAGQERPGGKPARSPPAPTPPLERQPCRGAGGSRLAASDRRGVRGKREKSACVPRSSSVPSRHVQ